MKKYDPKSAFDDTKLPENKLSAERMLEIEKKAKPHMNEAIKKLKKIYPGKK